MWFFCWASCEYDSTTGFWKHHLHDVDITKEPDHVLENCIVRENNLANLRKNNLPCQRSQGSMGSMNCIFQNFLFNITTNKSSTKLSKLRIGTFQCNKKGCSSSIKVNMDTNHVYSKKELLILRKQNKINNVDFKQ